MITEEDKKLLLKDLCEKLPYNVIVKTKIDEAISFTWCELRNLTHEDEICKPYLRPMSSMTEEEEKEYELLANRCIVTSIGFVYIEAQILIDWLNTHHFDYRGLIEKGLALEAPEGMYKI